MDYRPLDITVISASGLETFLFFKMKVYVVVSLINGKSVVEKKTHTACHGRNPTWNHRIKFPIEESALQTSTLLFVLRQHRLFGDKDIGEVSIPVRELLETNSGAGTTEHEVDYQVQSMKGKCKGTFTFSHEFRERVLPARNDGGSHPPPPPAYMVNQQGMPSYPQPVPYPPPPPPGYYAGPQYGGTWYPPTTPPGGYYPPQPVGYNPHVQ